MKLAVDQLFYYSANLACANCGSSVICRKKSSINFICSTCSTVYKIKETFKSDFEFQIENIQINKFTTAWQPLLKIGENIQLKNVDYQVIGAILKTDNEDFTWTEYCLINKRNESFYLTEYNGHWTFLNELKNHTFSDYRKNSDKIDYDGKFFKIYSKYTFKITNAAGEFPIDISGKNQKIKVQEFISPPFLLTSETEILKDNWFMGEYIQPIEIENGLSYAVSLPERNELGSLEVLEDSFPLHEIVKATFLLLTALFFFQIAFIWSKSDDVVLNENFKIESKQDSLIKDIPLEIITPKSLIVSKSFTIKEANSLDFELEAPINNSWFEAEIALINEKTGEEKSFSLGVEYYQGVESGESWAEGSKDNDYTISNVQPGIYHLEIQPICDKINPIDNFQLKTTWSTRHFTDFFIVLLLLLIYPVYKYFKVDNDERNRWSASDYSPYDDE